MGSVQLTDFFRVMLSSFRDYLFFWNDILPLAEKNEQFFCSVSILHLEVGRVIKAPNDV